MGIYLNPGGEKFKMARRSEIYVDKSGIIAYLNKVLRTEDRFVCVSRPRRFGKSMAANMIAAYYDRTANVKVDFQGMKIADDESFSVHFGKYDVIQINMQQFLSRGQDIDALLKLLRSRLLKELLREYPGDYMDETDLVDTMNEIYARSKRSFVIIIDEWDCIFREYKNNKDWQNKYLDFLRYWLKDNAYVGLAYMTGILPIKKYGTHSALNMFKEFSMTDAGELAQFVGFTEDEVRELCRRYNMSFKECKAWYDGYHFDEVGSIYGPRSVVQSMMSHKFDTYWNQTETFEALKIYIDMDYDGLREAIIALMAGEKRQINTHNFVNDMTTFADKDDVLTLLIHLGYLGYLANSSSVFVPNQEIMIEYGSAVRAGGWDKITTAIKKAEELLQKTLAMDSDAVANGIADAHFETSHLQYNDENALAYTLSLAYYTARQKYVVVREMPTGKGFADLVFLPRPKYTALPALIIELKWNMSAMTAINQIKEKKYPQILEDYTGEILLVGISYDKADRRHTALIERFAKE